MAPSHKRLVACFDGTWKTADDKGNATNPVKLMRAIRHVDDQDVAQITFYDKGVGTGGPIDRFRGGAFGRGLGENVRDGYRFLANNYAPGDEIYLFGFSRGAFTARSLAGLIGTCGLLTKMTLGEMMRAWNLYRTPKKRRDPAEARAIRRLGHGDGVRIGCIGVWDTVGSLGIPISSLNWMNRGRYKFHDTRLGPNIDCALHAVAIDEKRGPFRPALWQTPDHDAKQVVEQVWFPGVHSNIGGSYDDAGLSDIALDWMIKRARTHTPLAFDDAYIERWIAPDPLATLYESRSAMYPVSLALPFQRVIGGQDGWIRTFLPRTNKPDEGRAFVNEALHQSALDRFEEAAPFRDGGREETRVYAPDNVRAARGEVPVVSHDGEPVSPATTVPEGRPQSRNAQKAGV